MSNVFEQNRMQIDPAVWQPYVGQWVAYNAAGTQILAGAPELAALLEKLDAAQIDISTVVLGKITTDDDEILFGSFELSLSAQ